MIKLPDKILPADIDTTLATYQNEVDTKTTFVEKVKSAKALFSKYNKKGNSTFDKIKEVLVEMCSGAARCGYCEDSKADEVEHIQPKDIYPELVFVWENYLYACGPCNGPKNNKFAIFEATTGTFKDITPQKGSNPVAPPSGDVVLINPRTENPMDFLILDLVDTFFFVEVHDVGTKEFKRAEYTKEILGLNSRDYLALARKNAFENYCARLLTYNTRKLEGAPDKEIQKIREGILKEHHPTVWKEMQRQYHLHDQLKSLFEAAPEALQW